MSTVVDDSGGGPSHLTSQQATPMNQFFDQSILPPGPVSRWQGPGQSWPQQPTQESPLVGGPLSPLSQFGSNWQQSLDLNRPWASPTQATNIVAPPWNGTPFPGTHNPIDPAFTGFSQSAQSESTAHPWGWARHWPKGSERPSVSSATSSPDSRGSPGNRPLTPFQSLSRHDSVTTISSGYSKSSPKNSHPSSQPEFAMATGRPPQQWRADFKMPRTGLSALMHRKKRSIAYPG